MEKSKEILWHHLPLTEIFSAVGSTALGLTQTEADKRIAQDGLNELPRKKPLAKLKIFISQFKSALVYILLMAASISLIMGERADALVILFVVTINVIFGYVQESKAQNELEKLRKIVVPKAKVKRDGVIKEIEAKFLVPGDLIILEAGDKVTADARLLADIELEITEAPLTGESAPVIKEAGELPKGTVLAERSNMVFQGTQVTKGRGQAVVAATGFKTQLGKVAKLLKETEDEATPLQKRLNNFSKSLGIIILFLSFVILMLGLLTGKNFVMMFNTAVAIAVSAIPEGLAMAVTVILAVGMRNILKYKALVRKLVAAETLGSTTVICTDKTGTITEGEMRVTKIITNSYQIEVAANPLAAINAGIKEAWQLLKIGLLCNDAIIQNEDQGLASWQIIGTSTEKALLLVAAQIGLSKSQLEKENPRLDELVFSSERKYMATLHRYHDKHHLLLIKGAPEIVLAKASQILVGERPVKIYSDKRKEFKDKYELLSKSGLRTLALGYQLVSSKVEKIKQIDGVLKDLILVGFVGIKDPLRTDVKETLAAAKKAGVESVIITGDNRITAEAIAAELGLNNSQETILDGHQLLDLNDEQLQAKVKEVKIYARVMPQDKLRIVEAWQKHGAVVAMTGDGINDAPALKKADIGVALGSGTEVAKETADVVLLNDSFSTLVVAIEQGRIIYENIKKVILYLLSDSFSEVILVFGSLMLGWPLPLLPIQILWINIITDGFPNLALTIEPGEKEVMTEPPQERDKPILDFERRFLIGVISGVTALVNLGIFFYFWKIIGNLDLARSVIFVSLGVDSLLYVFSCRSLRHSIFHTHFFSNKYLLLAVGVGFLFQLLAVYLPFLNNLLQIQPLGLAEWSLVLMVSLAVIIIIEAIKWFFITRHKIGKFI